MDHTSKTPIPIRPGESISAPRTQAHFCGSSSDLGSTMTAQIRGTAQIAFQRLIPRQTSQVNLRNQILRPTTQVGIKSVPPRPPNQLGLSNFAPRQVGLSSTLQAAVPINVRSGYTMPAINDPKYFNTVPSLNATETSKRGNQRPKLKDAPLQLKRKISDVNYLNAQFQSPPKEVKLLSQCNKESAMSDLNLLKPSPTLGRSSRKDLDILQKHTSSLQCEPSKNKKVRKVKIIQYEKQSRVFRKEKLDHVYLEANPSKSEEINFQFHGLQQEIQEQHYEMEEIPEFNLDDSTNIKVLLEENDICDEIKQSIVQNVENIVQSENRLEAGAKLFLSQSEYFLEQFVAAAFEESQCCQCEKEGLISCDECGIICADHDVFTHSKHPLHIRYAGTLKLEPGVSLDKVKKNLVSFPVQLPVRVSKICQCGLQMEAKMSSRSVKCLDTVGAFEAKVVDFICASCSSLVKSSTKDYFSSKLFPLDCNQDSHVFVTFRLLELWKNLKNNCPPLGQGAFLKAIMMTSLSEVKQPEFDQVYQEFNNLQFKFGKKLGENYHDCPAKLSEATRIHKDGNSKLSRFCSKFQRKTMKESYYGDEVIMNDNVIREEINKYKNHKLVSSKMSDAKCGPSHWKAAENRTLQSSVLDEKGINFAACSHYCILLAVNQPFGEIYCLHNIGIANIALRGYNIVDVALDVACKYRSWNEKLLKNEELKKSLLFAPNEAPVWIGDVHSKGHSSWCQILFGHKWNGIGRGSAGEQVEVLNSPLSQLKFRTRFMGAARRNDEITELILYKNKIVDENIVQNIVKTLERYQKESDTLRTELACLEEKNNFIIDDTKIDLLKTAAGKVVSAKKEDLEERLEMLAMSVTDKTNQLKTAPDIAMKNKVKLNLEGAHKKLAQAILQYNEEKNTTLIMENVLLGIFPWHTPHLPTEMQQDPVTYLKAAQIFLKLKRTKEEFPILIKDIEVILQKRAYDIENLEQTSSDSTAEWERAKFLKCALLKEQLKSEIQIIRLHPHLEIPTTHLNVIVGEGRPLFRCVKTDNCLDELTEAIQNDLFVTV